jgi:hypothetical protein
MSAKRDNILMWSHYANKHAGLCLELRRTEDLEYALRVTYSERSPVLDFFAIEGALSHGGQAAETVKDEFIKAIYLTKAVGWRYEAEWRLIDASLLGLHSFPVQLVSGVVFGCRTSAEDQQLVRRWIARASRSQAG